MDVRPFDGIPRVRFPCRFFSAVSLTRSSSEPIRTCRFSHDGAYLASTSGESEVVIVRSSLHPPETLLDAVNPAGGNSYGPETALDPDVQRV